MTNSENKDSSAHSDDAPNSGSDTEAVRKLVVPPSETEKKVSTPRTPGNTDRDALLPDAPTTVTEEVVRKLVVPTNQSKPDFQTDL